MSIEQTQARLYRLTVEAWRTKPGDAFAMRQEVVTALGPYRSMETINRKMREHRREFKEQNEVELKHGTGIVIRYRFMIQHLDPEWVYDNDLTFTG